MQTPNQVPDVPDYVLGVLTVRGQILPVIDLRRLLQQRSLADEFADNCRPLREEYERWIDQAEKIFADGFAAEGGQLGHASASASGSPKPTVPARC